MACEARLASSTCVACLTCGYDYPSMPNSVLFQIADPADPDIDSFSSGDAEVDSYFRGRSWFNAKDGKCSPPTYQFRTGTKVLGYAAATFANQPHPIDASKTKAKCFAIYVVGVHKHFRGVKNPQAPIESYAVSIFRQLEKFAREKPECVGLSLWVRSGNERAIEFYRKFGFEADPAGAVQRKPGDPHLTMRKPITR